MDTPPTADVLLEDVETTQETVQRTAQTRGTPPENKMIVSSRKGYWKLSRTLATNMGMGNAWLEEQGLISLKEQWSKIHYPAT